MALSHQNRLDREIAIFKDQMDIHDLPNIFHYWSNKHLPPYLLDAFDFGTFIHIFAEHLAQSIERTQNPKIVSVGAGDGSTEIAIAKRMHARGVAEFEIHCLELSPHLITRGQDAATQNGVAAHVKFHQIDLNKWRPDKPFGGAFAHHSLHHFVELEHIFKHIKQGLADNGAFVIADMIGRNGHMRWPETLGLIDNIWSRLPPSFKYNHQFKRTIDPYLNWDCSGEGFEGVRAQDILPLLLKSFHFERFCAWGGLLDQFIDRGYGHNFDSNDPEHLQFIDDLWAADLALLRLGATTPTQVVAVMRKEPCTLISSNGLSPHACVRVP